MQPITTAKLSRAHPTINCAIAACCIAVFLGLVVASALTAPVLATVLFGLICIAIAAVIAVFVLRPAIISVRIAAAGGADHFEIRKLRRALDRLPETSHPLGL